MRNRMVHSEIHRSASLRKVSRDAMLTFILLWRLMDDYGRVEYVVEDLMEDSYRRRDDVDALSYASWIDELIAVGCLIAYTDGGRTYLAAPNWDEYQRINRPSKQRLPAYNPTAHKRLRSVGALGVDVGPVENPVRAERAPEHSLSAHGVLREPVENKTLTECSLSAHHKRKGRKERKRTTSFPYSGVKGDDACGKVASTSPPRSEAVTLDEFRARNPDTPFPAFLKGVIGT